MTPIKSSQPIVKKLLLPPLYAIAACDPTGVMGREGELPWGNRYPEDLAHFREKTKGQIVIMGRKTYDSLPRRVFETRTCLVLTRTHRADPQRMATPIKNLGELEEIYLKNPSLSEKKSWVIGGAEIFDFFFRQGLIQEALITHIRDSYGGDVLFPLYHLCGWERELVRETPSFSIFHYKATTSAPPALL